MTERELLVLAREACEAATKAGADFAEARVGEGRSLGVRLERSAVDATEANLYAGASIKAYVNGGVGSFSLDGLSRDEVVKGATRAAEMAKFAMPDKDFVTLPEPSETTEVPGLYDPAVEEIDVSALARVAMECVEAAKSVAPDAVCTGSAGVGVSRSAIANSRGVGCSSSSSSISAWIEPIIRNGDDVGAFYDYDAARLLADFDHRQIGVTAAQTALRFLGARKIESAVLPVVLGPLAARSLGYALAASAEAESHQRGRSWLLGMVGKPVASEVVTLRDDGTIPAGLGSRPYDSEGVPTRPLTIIENGVLTTLLHNSYTANKAGSPYTGHAQGGGIGPTNVIPQLGQRTSEEIIKDTKRGLYLNMGSLSPDGTTGEVSATVDFGFMIENGELTYPVASTMIGMNGLEMMKSIDAISSDARLEPGGVLPTIRVQGAAVAGGK